jgi:hypothetical protein
MREREREQKYSILMDIETEYRRQLTSLTQRTHILSIVIVIQATDLKKKNSYQVIRQVYYEYASFTF